MCVRKWNEMGIGKNKRTIAKLCQTLILDLELHGIGHLARIVKDVDVGDVDSGHCYSII